jgi:hypothetical protein
MDLKVAKIRYNEQKSLAKIRSIPFLFTFEEWCYIWEQSGKWDERGRKKGQYAMSRYGDKGAYEINNVFIQLHGNNVKDAHLGTTLTEEHKAKLSKSLLGNQRALNTKRTEEVKCKMSKSLLGKSKSKLTCPHCNLTGGSNAIKRWHFDNCKKFDFNS